MSAVDFFRKLRGSERDVVFLHSGGEAGGKSFVAFDPVAKFSGCDGYVEFVKFQNDLGRKVFGYFSYDLVYRLMEIEATAVDDLNLPEVYLVAFNEWVEFENGEMEVVGDDDFKNRVSGILEREVLEIDKKFGEEFAPTMSEREYEKSYLKIKEYIRSGDIYQINLTHRLEGRTEMSGREFFVKIMEKNAVDYLAYIEGDGFEVLSASPERFVKIEKERIVTNPIKGTRPRGRDENEDLKFSEELLASEKEMAELNMITDLLRNDIGRVSEIGSVKVEEHRALLKCPTVWHVYSKISGKLKEDLTPLEAMVSMLPGGSITGCPKKRACEVIDELEPVKRSVYTGVIGFVDPDGDLEFSIAIRTLIKKDEQVFLQVGGGIVLDSTEKAEFQETFDKAKSFMGIIG